MLRRVSPLFRLAVLVLSSLVSHSAAAQTASLLRDILPSNGSSFGNAFLAGLDSAGEKLFFLARVPETGAEVWVSDGTSSGTEMLRDGCPGFCSPEPHLFGALGRTMLWSEMDGAGAVRLWRSDGSRTGTFPLTGEAVDVSNTANNPALYGSFAGGFYFIGCQRANGDVDCDLWRTEGTVEKTLPVDTTPKSFGWLAAAGSRLYYLASTGQDWELWSLAGALAPPQLLRRFLSPQNRPPSLPIVAGGRLFFLAEESEGEELWVSDGTAAGTKALTRFAPSRPIGSWLEAAGSRVYFVADEGRAGVELWRSDGTAAGTLRLTNLPHPRPIDGTPSGAVAAIGDQLIFSVRSQDETLSLWTSRGTTATTFAVPLSCTDCQLNRFRDFIEAQGKAYFFVEEGFETTLWVTNGSAAGTRSLFPACVESFCEFGIPRPWRNGVLFALEKGSESRIWFSDGTTTGTRVWSRLDTFDTVLGGFEDLGTRTFFLAADRSGSELRVREPDGEVNLTALLEWRRNSSGPADFLALGDRIFFTAQNEDSFSRRSLWTSLGTPESTVDLTPRDVDLQEPPLIARAGPLVYFQTEELGADNLWRTDGTAAGTFVFAHLQREAPMAAFGDGLVFFDGGWIWRTDGTVAGTVKTGDLPANFNAERLWTGPNGVYLMASTPSSSSDLWITDGTTGGTRRLTHFDSLGGVSFGFDPELTLLGGLVYFTAPGGIWRTDGTEAGTVNVVPLPLVEAAFGLTAFQGNLYFFQRIGFGVGDFRLRRTDGTPAGGSVEIARFPGQSVYAAADGRLTPFGDRAYFAVDDGVHGRELWATDGTPEGTALVRDILPGRRGSTPAGLFVAGGALYFTAGETAHGFELWKSDGTAAGTRLVQDIAPLGVSSSPSQLTAVGSRLYFGADDGLRGREPWVLPLAGASACQASPSRLCLGGGRYAVEALWRDHGGTEGTGHPVALTADTGYFWFFDPANVETVLKVLDGRGVNGHVWTFYGALSDVEYALTVTDTETGLSHRYLNPPGQLASVADTRSFGPDGANLASGPAVTTSAAKGSALPLVDRRVVARAATGSCAPSSNRLCLNGGRYSVEVAWKDFTGNVGTGQAVGLTADTGYFWFFDAANVELVLKVLDGAAVNGHAWVFYGALSSVEYTVTVTDTQTGEVKTYRNPSGNLASVADIEAF